MTGKDPRRAFDAFKKKAEKVARDPEMTRRIVDQAVHKAKANRDALGKVRQDFNSLLRMLGAWGAGRYTKLPWQTLVMSLAGVLYFVNPFDAVPDFIAGVGLLDDATVLAFVLQAIRNDLEEFYEWEGTSSKDGSSSPPQT